MELDRLASERQKPYAIITADGADPKEYDDGISVTPLPSAEELYRVQVFAADTSHLYQDGTIANRVLENTQAQYHDPDSRRRDYKPMLPLGAIRSTEFAQGTVRKALVVSFLVGRKQPPSEVEIGFGRVEVRRNYGYGRFGKECSHSQPLTQYGRAAALILRHLSGNDIRTEKMYSEITRKAGVGPSRRGARMNAAYMIAANHLVGSKLRDENHLAIYRTHGQQDDSLYEFLRPDVARFSASPAPHQDIGIDAYCRVTSPLRRAEDFVMLGLLRARAKGREPSSYDQTLTAAMIRRLNQRIISEQYRVQPQLRNQKLWPASSLADIFDLEINVA